MRKPFFSQEKKGFRAFQRKAIMREQKKSRFFVRAKRLLFVRTFIAYAILT